MPIEIAEGDDAVDSGGALVRTGAALTDIGGEGWVPQALVALVSGPRERFDMEDFGGQVRRCEQLGHRLAWSPTVMPLVECARLQCLTGDRAGEASPPGWDDRAA